ncbi:MAG: hypothetical protein QXF01_01700 [Candidatus Micrarchaeaceae archaeon]
MHERLKQQSALEYLITYSWALLVLAVVLAVILSFNLLNYNKYVHTECVLGQTLTCENAYISSNGMLTIEVLQSGSDPINITSYGCTQGAILAYMQQPANQIYMPIGGTYTFNMQCYTKTGSPVGMHVGTTFSGSVFFNYTDEITGYGGTAEGKVVLVAR